MNGYSIHAAVLEHIRRVAAHPTRCAVIIRDAVKAMPTHEKIDAEQAAISRRIREVDKRTKHVMVAIVMVAIEEDGHSGADYSLAVTGSVDC